MKVAVTSNGTNLDAQASPVFGRCPTYIFVDTDTMDFEVVDNPAMGAAGGAGIQAAQFVAERGAKAVITGNVGPNAFNVFQSAGVPVHVHQGGTVRQVVEAYKAGQLPKAGEATAAEHAGLGRGRGMGRGMGRGIGMRQQTAAPAQSTPTAAPASNSSRQEEIASLKEMAAGLREQLAEVMDRLDQLEEEK